MRISAERELAALTWFQARERIPEAMCLVLPVGAAAKEHGPHLRLDNDHRLAHELAARVAERLQVLVLPTLPYGYYPAFLEYPGSVSLGFATFRDSVVEICQSLSPHGARGFYVLNTGISTLRPLAEARSRLANLGIRLRFTDFGAMLAEVRAGIETQSFGSHADEIETSIMLHVAPESVCRIGAVADGFEDRGGGGLSPDPEGRGIFSRTGVYGDATRASAAKGEQLTRRLVECLVRDIEDFAGELWKSLEEAQAR